jgi:hypothetical protein
MAGERNILKKMLGVIIMIGISVPLIQHSIRFANEKELRGAYIKSPAPTFSYGSWSKSTYQDSVDSYLNDNFGFRSSFVRLHNQIKYSLFSEANAKSVLIGKDWYMYEYNYIRAYFGTDFVGDSIIKSKVEKLKVIQDILRDQGKEILVVLAPGKGSFFPEYFPDSCSRPIGRTNYDGYLQALNQIGVNFVDFKRWFLDMKGNSQYPLFAQGGIHWSKYGEYLAADSLLGYLESLSNRDFPKLVLDEVLEQDYNDHGDYDIGEGMNLIFRTPTFPMGYPQYHIEQSENNTSKVLFVADSYYWGMFNNGFSETLFNDGKFWFYNESIYPDSYDAPLSVKNIDIRKEVEKNDVIVLLSTDANLFKFAFGFIDQLYAVYSKELKD